MMFSFLIKLQMRKRGLLLPHQFVVVAQGDLAGIKHLEVDLVPVYEKFYRPFQIGLGVMNSGKGYLVFVHALVH
jgi:hypothetical protein